MLLDARGGVRFGSLWDYCGLLDAGGDGFIDQGLGRALELIGLSWRGFQEKVKDQGSWLLNLNHYQLGMTHVRTDYYCEKKQSITTVKYKSTVEI